MVWVLSSDLFPFQISLKMNPTLEFNGKEYDITTLSDNAKTIIADLDFIENEATRLQSKIRVATASKDVVQKALADELKKPADSDS